MNPLVASFILGVLIVMFCIVSFIVPFGGNFRDRVQKIQGFGVNLEVSVPTLMLIIGFVLIFFGGGIWLQLRSVDTQLETLKSEKLKAELHANDLQEKLDRASSTELVAFLKLDGVDESNPPDANSVECLYETSSGKGGNADVSVAPASGAFKIAIRDITRETTISNLILRTKDKKNKWKAEHSFMPLEPPTYELKPF